MEGRGVIFGRVGDGSRVYQAPKSKVWDLGVFEGGFLPTALSAVGPLGWIRIWCLHWSRPVKCLLQQKGLGGSLSFLKYFSHKLVHLITIRKGTVNRLTPIS